MDECPDVRVEFPDANNLMEFKLFLSPQDGLYAGGTYEFTVRVPVNYPFEPPKVHCDTLVGSCVCVCVCVCMYVCVCVWRCVNVYRVEAR
jgi:ubiquitin-protein ligase